MKSRDNQFQKLREQLVDCTADYLWARSQLESTSHNEHAHFLGIQKVSEYRYCDLLVREQVLLGKAVIEKFSNIDFLVQKIYSQKSFDENDLNVVRENVRMSLITILTTR